jgi:carbon-monoxide dehydrogenase medium subunit
VESALKGKGVDEAALTAASQQVGDSLRLRGDHFASAEYRRHLITILGQRALSRAAARAGR